MRHCHRVLFLGSLVLSGGLFVSCSASSGGSGSSGSSSGFQLESISVDNNAVWEINRTIEFGFSSSVDFSSVSSNTINITTTTGIPATGTFSFRRLDTDGDGVLDTTDTNTIVFQPNCPTLPDNSDAGLSPAESYNIRVVGRSSGTLNTIRSAGGRPLEVTQARNFSTPNSSDPNTLFIDTKFGPPSPVVRTVGSTSVESGVSFIEIGGSSDPADRLYFEFDPILQAFGVSPGANAPAETPLNLYSDPSSRIAFQLEFNQAVSPASTNISNARLRLEVLDSTGVGAWVPVETRVELVSNCTSAGATVRLEPVGVLPPGTQVRAAVLAGFQDLVGEANLTSQDTFGVAPTQALSFASLANPSDGSDAFVEEFDFGGDSPDSLEDTATTFSTPSAKWGAGTLTAGFDFSGTGGPGGDFDWVILPGETFVFDTAGTTISGTSATLGNVVESSSGGLVDIRNLTIMQGGLLRVIGNNTLQINATGTIRIDGVMDLSGFDAPDVVELNVGDQASLGGVGVAGGGNGGMASQNITTSTPKGGTGSGPFLQGGAGGLGGESGYAAPLLGKDARRPAGGGGGRFAADFDPNTGGLFAGVGLDGHVLSRGAVTNSTPALGGAAGAGAFADGDATNDFFGTSPTISYLGTSVGEGTLTGLVQGELTGIWAGYGGGGGGDALPSSAFPTPNWVPSSDERGGGGGGGAGGVRLRALGPIVFGHAGGTIGQILCEGGLGATGEDTTLLDHVGGTGGSGSGGHVILESSTRVDFTDGDPAFAAPMVNGVQVRFVSAKGGIGRVGPMAATNGDPVPVGISNGGSGGPGVIQIHVSSLNAPGVDPANTDIVIPTYADDADGGTTVQDPVAELSEVMAPAGKIMLEAFGSVSKARSDWISVGRADLDPAGGSNLVQFLFGGVDTTPGPEQGKVLATSGVVDDQPALLGPEAFPSATVQVLSDGVTLRIAGGSLDPLTLAPGPLSNDLYLRTPAILKNFLLRVTDTSAPASTLDFDVQSASYDDAGVALSLTLSQPGGTALAAFIAPLLTPSYELIPRFFRIVTDGIADSLPSSAFVRFTFEGAAADSNGNPDTSSLLIPSTGDISDFNAALPGELQFFRFEVEFNLDVLGAGLTSATKPIQVQFLKTPFRF